MSRISLTAMFLLVGLFAVSANAAPVAYSVNSDSGNQATDDSLYVINLATGSDQQIGKLFNGIDNLIDTEGLAIAPDGTLWGIDDDSLTLFPINIASGSVDFTKEKKLIGIPAGGGNDFGMTFTCSNTLFITSVKTQTLYQLETSGSAQVVGAIGGLGVNISAIAALGKPGKLYGLGNGQLQNGQTDAPNLYSIDPLTGTTTLIGPLGVDAREYNQGGLSFDDNGDLWAITDRRIINNSIENKPSQILRIDPNTGTATAISTTSEVGFESLAAGPPAGCNNATVPGTTQSVPTLGSVGQLLAIFVLLLSGVGFLRKRSF